MKIQRRRLLQLAGGAAATPEELQLVLFHEAAPDNWTSRAYNVLSAHHDRPVLLVECGFLSNPGEARLLESPQYQQALADGIARAVVHYFKADAAVGNL